MEQLTQLTADFSSAVWGLPLLILLIGGGLYLLIRSRFETFRLIGHAFQVLSGRLRFYQECVGFHEEPQCAAVCPVDCCVPDDSHVESEEVLLGKQRFMHPE